MVVPAEPKSTTGAVLALYERRILAGLCRHDNRDRGGTPHEAPTRNRRRVDGRFTQCEACYEAHLASKRRSRGE